MSEPPLPPGAAVGPEAGLRDGASLPPEAAALVLSVDAAGVEDRAHLRQLLRLAQALLRRSLTAEAAATEASLSALQQSVAQLGTLTAAEEEGAAPPQFQGLLTQLETQRAENSRLHTVIAAKELEIDRLTRKLEALTTPTGGPSPAPAALPAA
eukprot:EG_transcript_41073